MREIFSNSELASYNQHKTDFVLSKKMFSLNRNVSLLFKGLLKDWMAIKKNIQAKSERSFWRIQFSKATLYSFHSENSFFRSRIFAEVGLCLIFYLTFLHYFKVM